MGHRSVPHTGDVRIEAWAPSREQCVGEAVTALADSVAEVAGVESAVTVRFRVGPGSDEDMLVAALNEVIYLMDTADQVPVRAEVSAADGCLDVALLTAGTDRVTLVGAVPQGVSLYDLRFERGGAGWSCGVTLDV